MSNSINNELYIDVSHMFGQEWNVTAGDLSRYGEDIRRAAKAVDGIRTTGKGPDGSSVLFPHLPYLLEEDLLISEEEKERLLALGERAKDFDILISIGVGGSYLGNQALFDLFCGPYWNEMTKEERKGYPKVYFAGQNVDPVSLAELSDCIHREGKRADRRLHVLLLVISKSGTTIEPVSAVRGLEKLLCGECDLHLMAITDKEKGRIRPFAEKQHFPFFTVPDGIGGRFSVFSQVGLVFGMLTGMDIQSFLKGAAMVEEACGSKEIDKNPALLLGALKYIAMKDYGIATEIIMPYGDTLRSFGWWYAQLLGESLGKKYDIRGREIHYGRIPVAAVGTTDMHSLTQEHQQGAKNKLVQFISVKESRSTLSVPCEEGGEKGMVPMDYMLESARKANEKALACEGRMSCSIRIRKITPFHMGALMYFFFLTIAYEGALAGINAYDQPGVEDYKKILHQDIREYIVRNK